MTLTPTVLTKDESERYIQSLKDQIELLKKERTLTKYEQFCEEACNFYLCRMKEEQPTRMTRLWKNIAGKKAYRVKFFFANGFTGDYTLKANDMWVIKFQKGHYIVVDSMVRWNTAQKLYEIWFHEKYCLPIYLEISSERIKQSQEQMFAAADVDLELIAAHPRLAKEMHEGQHVAAALQGAKFKILYTIAFVSCITLAAVLINMVMTYNSGKK